MNSSPFEVVRRLGRPLETPQCVSFDKCPEILELSGGDFAIIGKDVTDLAKFSLPCGVGCGAGERVVVIPRALLMRAKRDIPEA